MSNRPRLSLTIQYPDTRLKNILPRPLLRRWVQATLQQDAQLTIRIVTAAEARTLNREFRSKDYATNVLTFPYESLELDMDELIVAPELADDFDDEMRAIARADIVMCTDILLAECHQQHKALLEHAAHLIIHGTLHAQGYDHVEDDEAEIMEAREVELLAKFGFANPYVVEEN